MNLNWNKFLLFVKNNSILLIIFFGFLIGLYYVFTVPPWMHYDEPGHFEYAWLIANNKSLPKRGDYDQYMRRQISASIIEVDIEGYTGMTTDPLQTEQPITIWVTHIGNHPPTYYILASLPLRLFKHSNIVFQLYLVRLVSLTLLLILIWVSYKTCQSLFGEKHALTWMVPLFMISIPSFVDIMTAANNDVMAILAFSLFFRVCVEILKKGVSLLWLGTLATTVALCLFSKNTAWLAAPLSLLVVIFAYFKGKNYEKYVWGTLGGILILGLGSLFSWRDNIPAFFYSDTLFAKPRAIEVENWDLGEKVFAQNSQNYFWNKFYNLLSAQDTASLATKTVTFGAWIWADAPTSIAPPGIREGLTVEPLLTSAPVPTRTRLRIPLINDRELATPIDIPFSSTSDQITDSTSNAISISTSPQFYTFTGVVPPMGDNITWVYFNPSTDKDNRVYWDGIVLVEGDFSDAGEPVFDNEHASSGTWGGVPFTNTIRNASGEKTWPVFADWVNKLLPGRIFLSTSDILSVFDFRATSLYFQYTAERLFRTFWAVFGWANVPMYGQKPYRFFFLLTFIYAIGILLNLFDKSNKFSWQVFLIMIIAVILQVIMVVMRGVGSWFSQTYIPVARYIYPAILPLGILLTGGAHQIIRSLHKVTHAHKSFLYGLFICMQLGIILWAMVSIRIFYRL